MSEVDAGLATQVEVSSMPILLEDSMVWYLARNILVGEIELDTTFPHITDKFEYDETCAEIREYYGVQQNTVEQAIEAMKHHLQMEDSLKKKPY